MAVVILVMGIILALVGNLISSIPIFQSSGDESQTLKGVLTFCRQAATKSNSVVYLEINLDEDSYKGYRINRTDEETEEVEIVKERNLSFRSKILAVSVAGVRSDSGKLTIPFYPDGSAEQLALYLGPDGEIKKTVVFNRYGGTVSIVDGEPTDSLENPDWKENLEEL